MHTVRSLTNVPLTANPSGAPPNFVNPPSLNNVTYAIISTMMVLAFVGRGFTMGALMFDHGRFLLDLRSIGDLLDIIPVMQLALRGRFRERGSGDSGDEEYGCGN